MASSQLELAAYASGTLSYLTQGSDYEALDLSQHVRPHGLPSTTLADETAAAWMLVSSQLGVLHRRSTQTTTSLRCITRALQDSAPLASFLELLHE